MIIQKSYQQSTTTLFIVPTPIGNLQDMTFRSIEVLKSVDCIFCEDKRVTQKLITFFEINTRLASYHEHNKDKQTNKIIELLANNQNVALVSDAGMPGISDPGFLAIKSAKEAGYQVVVLPGASAFLLPIVHSNLAEKQFLFYGFLNKSVSKRKTELSQLLEKNIPVVIYESPHQLLKTLGFLSEFDSEAEVCVGRELSKIYEEYIEGTATEVFNHYQEHGVKGECVVVFKGQKKMEVAIDPLIKVKQLIETGCKASDAIRQVAKETGIKKNIIYQQYLEEQNE